MEVLHTHFILTTHPFEKRLEFMLMQYVNALKEILLLLVYPCTYLKSNQYHIHPKTKDMFDKQL